MCGSAADHIGPTLKDVVDQKDSFSIRTLNGAIQLEHFRNVPGKLVIDLYEEAGKSLLMKSVIKNLTFDRLTYFHCPHDVWQRICSKLDISMLMGAALGEDRKRD